MRVASVALVLGVSLVAGWLLGSVLPWWGTMLLVFGALGYVRLRLAGKK